MFTFYVIHERDSINLDIFKQELIDIRNNNRFNWSFQVKRLITQVKNKIVLYTKFILKSKQLNLHDEHETMFDMTS